jgi:protease I
MGAVYTDQDVVVDGDLVTGRTGGHCHLFARAIIDLLVAKEEARQGDAGGAAAGVAPRLATPAAPISAAGA